MKVYKAKNNVGSLTLELLVGISIFSLVLVALSFSLSQFINTTQHTAREVEALYLAEEVLEMVRFIRDNEWATIDSLTEDQVYYLDITSSSITPTTVPEQIGDYERSFILTSVWRDADDSIVQNTPGSSIDDSSRYVTATVTWGTPERSVELTTILTDIKDL